MMSTQRISGTHIAAHRIAALREDIQTLPRAPHLRVVCVGVQPAIASYIRIKERRAKEAGIAFSLTQLPEESTAHALVAALSADASDALVVQLPLPPHIDTDAVLEMLPTGKDADILSPQAYAQFAAGAPGALLPPVVYAVQCVLAEARVSVAGRAALVVGNGRLVGKPVAKWLAQQGARVTVVTRDSGTLAEALAEADLVVSGAGVPRLITPEQVRPGAVLIDAGTSELGGVLVGDIDPACEDKASVFTPMPGGIGPLTVAGLLSNVVAITSRRFA
ncbi:MAG TPA: bifunctional 5,10-methylenetetrahydrofolate dehydrogenase/5,10-methenyltetrahydrofolate cyclohydrolase [Candidatus Paceibacterota bacterium]|nr:bifunctional 5,10-methylenetetrahydrofolate dehydrogenase/5,10-methenyltetrahydrofolate cyclohydrolase [Candidatus Paceibacterota bacterium]